MLTDKPVLSAPRAYTSVSLYNASRPHDTGGPSIKGTRRTMSTSKRFDPGVANRDMATCEVPYDELAASVWAAVNACVGARTHGDLQDRVLEQILRAMRETHDSMRSVYSMAARVEDKEERTTGRWMDTVLLARPQYDAVFVGLLLAHDYQAWEPRFRKAGWAANAIRSFYSVRRFAKSTAWQKIKPTIVRHLKEHAREVGITTREWVATTAEVRGCALRFGACANDAVKPLPTPGQVIAQGLLKGGPFERLGDLLWQQWKMLCDPAHIGIGVLITKAALRENAQLDRPRERFIEQEIVDRSVKPSFVAIMTLVTVLAFRHRDNANLMAKVVAGWKWLERGTIEGGVVWNGWAQTELGVPARKTQDSGEARTENPDAGTNK